MPTSDLSILKLALKTGAILCVLFIIYFMIMKYFGLIQFAELRFLNIFILLSVLFSTFRYYRMKTKILNIDYLEGLSLGVFSSGIGFALFAVFLYIYFSSIDPMLLDQLRGNTVMMGNALTPVSAAGSVLIEGICSGLILSFSIMQYFKSGSYKTLQEKRRNGIHV